MWVVKAQVDARSRLRVWLALLGMPVVLGAAFLPFGAYLAISRGLRGEELARALEPIAVLPASIGFGSAFLLTRWLARRDSLPLADLGWRRPSLADVAVGLGAGVALWALNAWVLYPLVQASQPGFDPTLAPVSLPAAAVTMVVAATAEDTLYRGYAFTVLKDRHGLLPSVLVTTVLYALLTPARGLALVLWAAYFGAVLCGLRWWRKGLWPVVLAHCVVALGPKVLAGW